MSEDHWDSLETEFCSIATLPEYHLNLSVFLIWLSQRGHSAAELEQYKKYRAERDYFEAICKACNEINFFEN